MLQPSGCTSSEGDSGLLVQAPRQHSRRYPRGNPGCRCSACRLHHSHTARRGEHREQHPRLRVGAAIRPHDHGVRHHGVDPLAGLAQIDHRSLGPHDQRAAVRLRQQLRNLAAAPGEVPVQRIRLIDRTAADRGDERLGGLLLLLVLGEHMLGLHQDGLAHALGTQNEVFDRTRRAVVLDQIGVAHREPLAFGDAGRRQRP